MTQLEETAIMEEQALACDCADGRMTLSDLVRKRGRLLSILDLAEFMKPFDLVSIINVLAYMDTSNRVNEDDIIERFNQYGGQDKVLKDFDVFAKGLNCDVTSIFAGEALRFVQYHPVTLEGEPDIHRPLTALEQTQYIQLTERRKALITAFLAEMPKHMFYYMGDESKIYKHPLIGWEKILAKWKDLEPDITQASECLALGQWTACVFHVARCAEYVLRSICVQEGVPHQGKATMMGNYLDDIEKHIKHPNIPPKMAELSQVMSTIGYLKNGWRDGTMHTGTMYKDFQAKAAYDAVKAGLDICVDI